MSEGENIQIDDTSRKHRAKVAAYLYNAFVDKDNFKNDIVIGPKSITEAVNNCPNSSSSTTENYVINPAQRSLHDLCLRRSVDLDITYNNVKTFMDIQLSSQAAGAGVGSYSGPVASQSLATLSQGCVSNGLGLANPCLPGIWGFTSDPLNKMITGKGGCKVFFGDSGMDVPNTMQTSIVDVHNRFLDKEDLLENYDGIRMVDKISKYEDVCGPCPIPFRKYDYPNSTVYPIHKQKSTVIEMANDPINNINQN